MIGGKGDFEGGIEITNDTEWFPVCKEGFSMSTATVVCQHFGYPARYLLSIEYTESFLLHVYFIRHEICQNYR